LEGAGKHPGQNTKTSGNQHPLISRKDKMTEKDMCLIRVYCSVEVRDRIRKEAFSQHRTMSNYLLHLFLQDEQKKEQKKEESGK